MRAIERRFFVGDVSLREEPDKAPIIEGYAALYYDGTPATEFQLWDGAFERIMPGAFNEAIENDDVRALFNHEPDNILGRKSAGTLKLSSDAKGLRYEITPPDTDIGNRVRTAIKRRDVTGSSFSFTVEEDNWRKTKDADGNSVKIREIVKVRPLFDTGPVTFPAYTNTTADAREARDMSGAEVSFKKWEEEEQAIEHRRRRIEMQARAVEIAEQE